MIIDPKALISDHFSYREALWLPSWNRMAAEEDGLTVEIIGNLKQLFFDMDMVRAYFGQPIIVHCAYRPVAYNMEVNGAKNSPHILGMACDFHIESIDCDQAKQRILDDRMLSTWNMRMEQGTTNWLHLDTRLVPDGGKRYFLP
jgi:zinc D-Ala-D-Ala carboxypeptidase